MRILIAEDEAISRRLLESTLTRWGYEVIVTCNGDDALTVLQDQDAPLLAILDVMMPGIEGIEVCRSVRQMSQASPTYIILLTAKSSKAEIVKGLQAGADDYLTKPFDLDELYARVQVGMRVVQLQRSLTGRVRQLELAEAELRSLSLTDDLTGLCNRRGFFFHAEQYLKTSRRLGKQFLLFYADMDGLKQINDSLGMRKDPWRKNFRLYAAKRRALLVVQIRPRRGVSTTTSTLSSFGCGLRKRGNVLF